MRVLDIKIEEMKQDCTKCKASPSYIVVLTGKEGCADYTEPLCKNCLHGLDDKLILEEPKEGFGAPPAGKMRKRVQKQELKDAEAMGGRTQPASGAKAHAKGDARKRGKWRIDSKSTTNLAFSLHIDIINKIRSECYGTEKFAIPIEYVDKSTNSGYEKVVVVPFEWWSEQASKE